MEISDPRRYPEVPELIVSSVVSREGNLESLGEKDISTRRSQTLDRLSRLPVFSQTALKLLTIATEEDSAREDFESAFRSDPSLASDLLIAANSAEFGFRAKVASISHALSLLGLERARSLACTIAMSFYLRSSASPDVSDHWKHSMASAALAEHLAEVSSLSPPLLYSAALLHDIGRLGLQQISQSDYSYLMALDIAEILGATRLAGVIRPIDPADHQGLPSGYAHSLASGTGSLNTTA